MKLVHIYSVCTDDYMPVAENTEALKSVYRLGLEV